MLAKYKYEYINTFCLCIKWHAGKTTWGKAILVSTKARQTLGSPVALLIWWEHEHHDDVDIAFDYDDDDDDDDDFDDDDDDDDDELDSLRYEASSGSILWSVRGSHSAD